jgi:acyl-CoA thioesterase
MASEFERDTAVRRLEDGVFEAEIEKGWWIMVGPNGGYVAAILQRAMEAAVSQDDRRPRSLTVHYTAPPKEGRARITTTVEREGGRLSTVTARLEQDGRLCALALGAFSTPRDALSFREVEMPDVPPPDRCDLMKRKSDVRIPIHGRYEMRPCIGATLFTGSHRAETGGWIRLTDPHPTEPAIVVAVADAWPPAIFARMNAEADPISVPTIDLSVHFRTSLPSCESSPTGENPYYLVRFRSTTSCDGFIEEDGEVWSEDGTLLAQSRQLAIVV